jgi:NADH:ubiquinone oxidoreductase subunit E
MNRATLEEMERKTEESTFDLDTVYKIIDSFPDKSRRHLIPVLSKIQKEFRWLSEEVIEVVLKEMNVTRAEIYGVISFYPQFRMTEPGKHIFRLCYGTACFVKGAPIIAEKLKEKYQMSHGETDPSKLFTLECASCLGNCAAAPMAIIGDDTYGSIDPGKTLEIAEKYS